MRPRKSWPDSCNAKLTWFKNNPDVVEQDVRDTWKKALDDSINGLENEWRDFRKKTIRDLANDDQNLSGWYNTVYRVACDPAHIGDLSEYMPQQRGPLSFETSVPFLRVHTAFHYGTDMAINLLDNFSEMYDFDLKNSVVELRSRYNSVTKLTSLGADE